MDKFVQADPTVTDMFDQYVLALPPFAFLAFIPRRTAKFLAPDFTFTLFIHAPQ